MTAYAEAEVLLKTWLDAHLTSTRVATEVPANLEEVLPCVVINRIGGSEDEVYTFDNATVDFECYAATRAAARTLAHKVRASIRRDLPGQTVSGASISRTRTSAGPIWTPYTNTNVRRFVYAASIRIHTPEAT